MKTDEEQNNTDRSFGSNSTSSDVGYPVPNPSMHSNRPRQTTNSDNDVMVINFTNARSKTKKYGRCILYFGLIIVLLNAMSILYAISTMFIHFSTKTEQRKKDEEMFGATHLAIIEFVDMISNAAEFAVGLIMIMMTKEVVK